MDDVLKKSTKNKDLLKLGEAVSDAQFILFLCKTLPEYPEYLSRLEAARSNALSEARVYKYPENYAKAFVEYRVDLELSEIKRDRISAFQLLEAKLLFTQPEILRSKEFIDLQKEIQELRGFL